MILKREEKIQSSAVTERSIWEISKVNWLALVFNPACDSSEFASPARIPLPPPLPLRSVERKISRQEPNAQGVSGLKWMRAFYSSCKKRTIIITHNCIKTYTMIYIIYSLYVYTYICIPYINMSVFVWKTLTLSKVRYIDLKSVKLGFIIEKLN